MSANLLNKMSEAIVFKPTVETIIQQMRNNAWLSWAQAQGGGSGGMEVVMVVVG